MQFTLQFLLCTIRIEGFAPGNWVEARCRKRQKTTPCLGQCRDDPQRLLDECSPLYQYSMVSLLLLKVAVRCLRRLVGCLLMFGWLFADVWLCVYGTGMYGIQLYSMYTCVRAVSGPLEVDCRVRRVCAMIQRSK